MANEITALATLTLNKGSSIPTLSLPSSLFTQTDDAFVHSKMDVPNSETAVDLGEVLTAGNPGWAIFINRSSTAGENIELRQGLIATYAVAAFKIEPGGVALIKLDEALTVLYAQSDAGTPLMEFMVFEV